ANLHISIIPATLDVATWRNFLDNGSIDGSNNQTKAANKLDTNGYNALQIYGSVKGDGNFGNLPIDAQHTGNLADQIRSGLTQSLYQTLTSHNSDTNTPLLPLPDWDMNTLSPVGGNSVPSGQHNPY